MSYSCTDFTETIEDVLGVQIPEAAWDDPGAQADICLLEIQRLQRIEKALKYAVAKFAETAERDGFIDRVCHIAEW